MFRQGLHELGYTEAKDFIIEYRATEGNRWQTAAKELAMLKVDVIVTGGSNATRAAKHVAPMTPIVMAQDPDRLAMVLSIAFHDRAETLQDCLRWHQILPEKG